MKKNWIFCVICIMKQLRIKGLLLIRLADDLLAHFDNLIETNPTAFLLAAQNEYLETKAMLFNAYCKGIIKMSDKQLWFSDKKLAEEQEEATLDNAAKFI